MNVLDSDLFRLILLHSHTPLPEFGSNVFHPSRFIPPPFLGLGCGCTWFRLDGQEAEKEDRFFSGYPIRGRERRGGTPLFWGGVSVLILSLFLEVVLFFFLVWVFCSLSREREREEGSFISTLLF